MLESVPMSHIAAMAGDTSSFSNTVINGYTHSPTDYTLMEMVLALQNLEAIIRTCPYRYFERMLAEMWRFRWLLMRKASRRSLSPTSFSSRSPHPSPLLHRVSLSCWSGGRCQCCDAVSATEVHLPPPRWHLSTECGPASPPTADIRLAFRAADCQGAATD